MVMKRASKFIKLIKTNKQHNEPDYAKHQRISYSSTNLKSLSELEKIKKELFLKHKKIREELKKEVLEINEVANKNTNDILKELGIKNLISKNEITKKELMDSSKELQTIKKKLVQSKRALAKLGVEEESVKIIQLFYKNNSESMLPMFLKSTQVLSLKSKAYLGGATPRADLFYHQALKEIRNKLEVTKDFKNDAKNIIQTVMEL